MKAKLVKLYHEVKCGEDWDNDGYPLDEVKVKLRKWSGGGHRDVVLEKTVVVDSEVEVESQQLLKPNINESKAIRLAIQTFDELVAAHPTLGGSNDQEQ